MQKCMSRTATSILDPSQVWVIPRRASFSVSVEFHGLQQHFVPLWTFVPLYPLSGTSRSTHALPLRHPTSFRARVDGSIHRSNVKASRTSCNSATDMACNARETTRSKWWLTGQLFYNSWMEIKWSFHRLLGLTWAIQGLFHGSLWFTWSCRYPTSSYETRGTCRATMATPKPFQLLPILGGNIWKVSTTVLDWTWVGKGLIVFSHLIHYALNQVFLSGHRWLWGPRSSSLICHSGYI